MSEEWPKWLRDVKSGQVARDRKPKKHEMSTAKALGGRVQPGSGSQATAKGDVRDVGTLLTEFLVECKRTEDQSLRVQASWLNKISTEAGPMKEPALAIQFDEDVLRRLATHDQVVAEADWVAVPRSVFRRMLSALSLEEES